ncbi:MAG: hypothetical protein ABEJ42_06210 [Halobacteriaceae archaeon]
MTTDESTPDVPADLTPAEARRRLISLIVRQDMEEHAEIYRDLERE